MPLYLFCLVLKQTIKGAGEPQQFSMQYQIHICDILILFRTTKYTFIMMMSCLLLQNFEPCPFSIPTVSVVKKCPKEKTEWETAREKKQCHWIPQNCTVAEKFQYHCLPTDTSGTFVEVCIPTIQIVGKNINCFQALQKQITKNINTIALGVMNVTKTVTKLYNYSI